ncbi:MAG: DUF4890 domain-containing protein [Bacteroidaceae bacterium]|nr:DUF4890 domain-containing protein [Bacteroidaceae bacterium]
MKKRIIFMLCAMFAVLTICTAQDNTGDKKAEREAKRAEMIKKATERMKNELSLSEGQATKLEEVNKEFLPKMRMGQHAARRHKVECPKANTDCKNCKNCNNCPKAKKIDKAKKGDKGKNFKKPTKEQMEKRKAEMRKTRKAYNEKLNEILTPEQQEKLKSLRKEKKGKKPRNKK